MVETVTSVAGPSLNIDSSKGKADTSLNGVTAADDHT